LARTDKSLLARMSSGHFSMLSLSGDSIFKGFACDQGWISHTTAPCQEREIDPTNHDAVPPRSRRGLNHLRRLERSKISLRESRLVCADIAIELIELNNVGKLAAARLGICRAMYPSGKPRGACGPVSEALRREEAAGCNLSEAFSQREALRDFAPPSCVAEIGQVEAIIASIPQSGEPGFEEG
jgi:hypothetical protein